MRVIETEIAGLRVIEPKIFGDQRGFFLEAYSERRYREAGIDARFVQDNVSLSSRGTLRGLHFQKPDTQGKLITVLQGEVYDVAVDIRYGSPTFGRWFGLHLNHENKRQLWIPSGFAHGFQVTSEHALVLYKCDAFYNPTAEKSILWNDPDLGIDWPSPSPILSAKDEGAGCLKELNASDLPH